MIEDVISYDGHAFAGSYEVDFVQGTAPGLPSATVATLERIGAYPVVSALQRNSQKIALIMKITDYDNVHTLRTQLFRWFDPEDETPKKLLCENHADVEMYVYALCEELRLYSDPRHQEVFVATLVVDGDVRWRAETETSDTWNLTASGQTHVVANGGEDEAYPVYTIKPTSGKTGGYDYRRWVPVVWRSENAGVKYPVRAELDTDALVTAGKMQADGDDLRILSDNLQIDRWLDDMNTVATGIWFNLYFARAPQLTLATAIAGAGSIASIEVDDEEELALMPESGIVLIDDEAFTYTARNLTDKQLTGITRAAKGTSMGAHTVGDDVWWIQHDVYILYGNAAATAPTVDNYSIPAFELDDSDNEEWHYEEFGDVMYMQAASWEHIGWATGPYYGGCYTATQRTWATPWTAIGAFRDTTTGHFAQGWQLYNPCGIVNAAWADGQARAENKDEFVFRLRYWVRGDSWWSEQLQWLGVDDPLAADNTWEGWSESAAVADWDPADYIALVLYAYNGDFEAGTVTVSLNTDEVPLVSVNAEEGNYELACTLTNQTTGEALTLAFVMDVDSEIEIDTENRTVTWLEDDSRQFQALSLSTARRQWLRLLPGNNTLRFDDTGTGNVTVTTEFRARYY
ncbi:MAG: phage tail family protein [Anaerolineae bacterium]|nr:phage tail family protein [Anaerolineae bacterium]